MRLLDGLYVHEDTCNVYVLVSGTEATLIDFGSGSVLDHLAEYGVERVTDVLMTHHHRDQCQGLPRAVAAGIRVWVPPVERDLFADVGAHWQSRPLDNYYDLRQDRFSLLDDVPVHGVVSEYRTRRYGGVEVTTVPTPGHTPGSVSYLVDVGGRRVAFAGDLIYGPGKVWSLAATQWSYIGMEGAAATALSLQLLADRSPDLLLPSHGRPIEDLPAAFALLDKRLQALVDLRRHEPWDLTRWLREPYQELTGHLLVNRTSIATSYVLLSDSGAALLLDFGFDLTTGLPAGHDRSARRPWLASLDALRRRHGVDRVEVAMPTHYHDDHVAGFNLLREVEGTEVWAADTVAPVLESPTRFDLPCLWYDPIPVDRVVPVGQPVRWREYELTMFPLPGHTLYAVAIAVEVDGVRVVATGDQQDGRWVEGERAEFLNWQYKNRFQPDDFVASAQLYRRLQPDLLISGHWEPRKVDESYLDMLLAKGRELASLHRELLPLEEVDFGAEGFGARIEPYRSASRDGSPVQLQVEVRNPFGAAARLRVELVAPRGWQLEPAVQEVDVAARAGTAVPFRARPPTGLRARRVRLAADLTVAGRRFGQHAEALVDVG